MNNFQTAIDILFKLEGGYVNDADDPGGETKYGISKKSFPDVDIPHLTYTDAQAIYLKWFWTPLKCDQLIWPLSCYVFDMGVNSGNAQAIKTLQKTLGITVDGIIGQQTISSANKASDETIALFLANRQKFYEDLPQYSKFGQGWTKRLFFLEELALIAQNNSVAQSMG